MIELERVGKRYALGEGFHRYETLRGAIAATLRRNGAPARDEVWALRDVTLAVDEGEAVGVIGANGAGKTTLLKILARITEPTVGVSRTRGRVGSLLEVGTGFHPELTGRENIYLNGAVLGMSRREVRRRFDEIVAFSGVETFLDTPLKRYSTGMYLRLAFSVAAHLEPEIMVVDEVLAVGDMEFQRRCLEKMSHFSREGRTILFVSHDLGAIARLCRRAVWLEQGRVMTDGASAAVIEKYFGSKRADGRTVRLVGETGRRVELVSVAVCDAARRTDTTLYRGEPFSIAIRFRISRKVPGLDVALALLNARGVRVFDEALSDTTVLASEPLSRPGGYEVTMSVPGLLPVGDYVVHVWIGTQHEDIVDLMPLAFRLSARPEDRREQVKRARTVIPHVSWRLRHTDSSVEGDAMSGSPGDEQARNP